MTQENTCRKNFAPSEAVAAAEAIEAMEKPKAAKRERSGKSSDGRAGGRGKKKPSSKLDEGLPAHRRESDAKVAEAVGMKKDTYRKAMMLVKHPERGHGKAPGAGRGKKKREAPKDAEFASLGAGDKKSKRTKQADCQIAESIPLEIRDAIRETPPQTTTSAWQLRPTRSRRAC